MYLWRRSRWMLFKTFLKSLILHQTHQVFYFRHPFPFTVKKKKSSLYHELQVIVPICPSSVFWRSIWNALVSGCLVILSFSFALRHGFGGSLELSVPSSIPLHPWICSARELQFHASQLRGIPIPFLWPEAWVRSCQRGVFTFSVT